MDIISIQFTNPYYNDYCNMGLLKNDKYIDYQYVISKIVVASARFFVKNAKNLCINLGTENFYLLGNTASASL